jgi:hypothetical protein
MPSFDIASEVDIHNLTNAVDQSNRVVNTRFDFKGTEASFVRDELTVQLTADAEFQAEQMIDILRAALIKCSVDPKAMQIQDGQASGKLYKQSVVFKNGLESDLAKKIVKLIKEQKFKVQTQIQGEQVRVTGKKRDDLQEVMAMLREADLEQPLQFTNFRD